MKVEVEPTVSPPKKSRGGGGAHYTTTIKSPSPAKEERRFTPNQEHESKRATRKLPESRNPPRVAGIQWGGGGYSSDSEEDVR